MRPRDCFHIMFFGEYRQRRYYGLVLLAYSNFSSVLVCIFHFVLLCFLLFFVLPSSVIKNHDDDDYCCMAIQIQINATLEICDF